MLMGRPSLKVHSVSCGKDLEENIKIMRWVLYKLLSNTLRSSVYCLKTFSLLGQIAEMADAGASMEEQTAHLRVIKESYKK